MEIIKAIIGILNSIGASVLTNYITPIIRKWLDSSSAGKKHRQKTSPELQLGGTIFIKRAKD